jgi:2',3'-cyclic-nucleotide 2'-phosphodiesterase (5'-nucleotidase family)
MLVLDAGDLLFKKYSAPIPIKELKAATEKAYLIIEAFNLMGYDAMGIGDDDLSLGKDVLLKVSKRAKFPILSSNVLNEASGRPLFQSSVIKEMNGLKIGIFSLLSQEVFLDSSDPRRKGLIIQSPVETAQNMVKELGSKVDLIVLLSHLGYSKDVELVKTVMGIHIVVGGHTGVHLTNPPVINNTLIVQNASKGMYATQLSMTLLDRGNTFYNVTTKRSVENTLRNTEQRLTSVNASETERDPLRRIKESAERVLQQFEGQNHFTYSVFPLNDGTRDHPDIKKMIEAYKDKFKEGGKTDSTSDRNNK